jgi:hypothetical protein
MTADSLATRCRALAGIAALLVLAACAGPSGPARLPFVPETLRAQLGTIGVSPAAAGRPDQIDVLPGHGESVLVGVREGALEGLALGGYSDGTPAAAVIGLLVMPYTAVVGGLESSRAALPEGPLEASVEAIERAILAARDQPSLAARVHRYARDTVGERVAPSLDVARAVATGVDVRLEIGDAIVLLEGGDPGDPDPPLGLRIETRVRLVRTADDTELLSFVRGWAAGEWHRIREWAEDDARRVREAVEWIQDLLAEKIVDHLLLVYHDERTRVPEDRRPRVAGTEWLADFPPLPPGGRLIWGLVPVYPPSEDRPFQVDTLRPTLVWEPFPGWIEVPGDGTVPPTVVPFVPVDLERVDRVTYEIQLRDDTGLIYRRRGLVDPSHTIEEPLRPGTTYQWALRAWFELDGEARVSEWSRSLGRDTDGSVYSSGWRGYYFETRP